MNQNKPAVVKKLQERFRNVSVGRGLYIAFVMPTMLSMFSTRAFAADTIWTKASAIMQDVYKQILSISTIAAVVTAAVALLLMNFSRSGRTVDESRAWLKRIIITWAILAELKPTIEFDDGISSGTLSLDHSTIKTEAAGYKSSSYTVTATKNYTGLDRNDSSYIDKTVEKNGRTLSLSNVTWSVESTALVGDELVPATYSAVATYSGTASSTVATGYITTAEYKGTVVSSGISSILYTVTYLGTEIVPVEEEPTFNGSIVVIPVIGGTILLATLLLLGLLLRKNTTVYKATGKGNEYEKCGRLRLKTQDPELRIDRLKDIPEGMIAVEVDQAVAKKLFGQTIAIHCYDNTVEHTVGTVNGQYWFKVDIGTLEGEPDTEEEPV